MIPRNNLQGTLYAAGADWNLYALNAATGAVEWKFLTNGIISSSPMVVNDIVYIGCNSFNLYALDRLTGLPKWKTKLGGVIFSSPTVVNGLLYVGCDDKKMYALKANTGAIVWTFETGKFINSSPAVVDGMVYFGGEDGKVYALNAFTGTKKWEYKLVSPYYASPTISNGLLYITQPQANGVSVHAINISNGLLKWGKLITPGGSQFASPSVSNGIVYVTGDRKVYALNALNGETKWEKQLGNPQFYLEFSEVTVGDNVLYTYGSDDKLYALNALNGQIKWISSKLGEEFNVSVRNTPVVAFGPHGTNTTVYISNRGGIISALDGADGKEKWHLDTEKNVWPLVWPLQSPSPALIMPAGYSIGYGNVSGMKQ